MLNDVSPQLSDEEFKSAVSSLPLVSIDLLVKDEKGNFLLGLRRNEPAKGSWFVPGGRIRKGETLREAFVRISMMELKEEIHLNAAKLIGLFEHRYDESSHGSRGGTQYFSLGFEVNISKRFGKMPQVQHKGYQWVSRENLLNDDAVHEYTKDFFRETPGVHYRID